MILLGGLLFSTAIPVLAGADTSSLDKLPQHGRTDGIIKFIPNDKPKDPVDPTDPNKPVDPQENPENGSTGNDGTLTLDVVPKVFNFGENYLTGAKTEYPAIPQTTTKQKIHYVQINENRSESNGWTLSVAMSNFKDASNVDAIPGASIKFPQGEVRNIYYKGLESGQIPDPSNNILDILTDDPDSVFTQKPIEVVSGGSAVNFLYTNSNLEEIDTAHRGAYGLGRGVTTGSWNISDLKLVIPAAGNSAHGQFESRLTWTLIAGGVIS